MAVSLKCNAIKLTLKASNQVLLTVRAEAYRHTVKVVFVRLAQS